MRGVPEAQEIELKQLLQNLGTGETQLADVPAPRVRPGHVLIATRASLVSLGTERILVEFGRAGWLEKARQQPEKVAQVLRKVRTDGLFPTLEAVRSKLDQPLALGYCNAGVVLEVGDGVSGFAPGDRVVSNGPHAEVVCVPKNLCVRLPECVDFETGAFAVPGAIALQGLRLLAPTLGERIVVTGLGLIGQLAVQLLRANGCDVLGIDPDPAKCALARRFGASTVELSTGEDPLSAAANFTAGRGVDGVLITASTPSNEPVHQAAAMCCQRGRIVLVGVTGLKLNRADFYAKELSFQVSCSYGPGRYDRDYEERGKDYPFGLVRWTEQRNFEAVLWMLARGNVDVQPLVTHRYGIGEAEQAYGLISGDDAPEAIGVLLEYAGDVSDHREGTRSKVVHLSARRQHGKACVAVLGAGNYASRVLLPALSGMDVRLKTLVSGQGVTGTHFGKKFGFEQTTTDAETVFADDEVEAVIVATRHDSHARYAVAALRAGRHVFVEKPLGIKPEEVEEIRNLFLHRDSDSLLMVGFNRRFSSHAEKMAELLGQKGGPKAMTYTINAGAVPAEHWTQDPEIGGGRIAGEACHFLDFCRFLAGSPIEEVTSQYLGGPAGELRDTAVLQARFADGSIASIQYYANGHTKLPKERVEIFCEGAVLRLDDFRELRGHGFRGFRKRKTRKTEKGHRACMEAFFRALREGGQPPVPLDEIMDVSEWILKV